MRQTKSNNMNDFLAIPEENDTIGFIGDDGELLDYISRVFMLNKSYVSESGALVFEVDTTDGETILVIRSEMEEDETMDWIECYVK